MKATIPGREVNVCDFCHREAYLQSCDVCKREFCLTDQGVVTGSYGFTKLCHECSDRDDVKKVCDEFAVKLAPLFKARDDRLRKLRKKTTA